MSGYLWPDQHARLPYTSPSTRVCSNSCPFCWWCHPTISSSVTPFSPQPQSFPPCYFSQGCLNFSKGCGQAVSCNLIPLNVFIVSDKSGMTGGSWPRNASDIPHFWTHHRSLTPNICSHAHLGESIPTEFLKITISGRPFSFYVGKLKKSFHSYSILWKLNHPNTF